MSEEDLSRDRAGQPSSGAISTPLATTAGGTGSAPVAAYAGADVAAYELVQAIIARQARRRGILQAVLFGAAIFACGGASGWGIAVLHSKTPAPTQVSPMPAVVSPTTNSRPNRVDDEGPRPNDLPPRPPLVDQLVDRLRHELQLNDSQARQMTDIYQRCFAALQAIRMQSMQPRYEQMRLEVQKVLTPEQFAQWDQRFRAMENQMLSPPRRRPPPPRDDEEGPPGPQ